MRSEEEAGRIRKWKKENKRVKNGKNTKRLGYSCRAVGECAAKALFSCPAIIRQRQEPRLISNEPLENTEEESKII